MSHATQTKVQLPVDETRREICQKLAEAIRAGVQRFQFRIVREHDCLSEAWIYVYQSHEWLKINGYTFPSELLDGLMSQMGMLATRRYSDGWACLRDDQSDRTDFKLMFRRKALEGHLSGNLESFLSGCLFHGHHDSGKDSRRRIRFQGR